MYDTCICTCIYVCRHQFIHILHYVTKIILGVSLCLLYFSWYSRVTLCSSLNAFSWLIMEQTLGSLCLYMLILRFSPSIDDSHLSYMYHTKRGSVLSRFPTCNTFYHKKQKVCTKYGNLCVWCDGDFNTCLRIFWFYIDTTCSLSYWSYQCVWSISSFNQL